MHTAEYASVFRDSYGNAPVPPELDGSLQQQADRWSSMFGHGLLEHMRGNDIAAFDDEVLTTYANWYRGNAQAIQSAPTKDEPGSQALQFHGLNGIMLDMWRPITAGEWSSDVHRRFYLKEAQDIVAIRGLELYVQKLRVVRELEQKGTSYFDNSSNRLRGKIEGRLHEYDAAVVLLGIAEKLETANVVAGPKQLEDGAASTQYGADFVFMIEDQAVGIQVKSSVSKEVSAQYDPSRVVLVDGRVDMGNEKSARTKNTSSAVERVSWAGLISASHVIQIPVRSHNNFYIDMGKPGGTQRTIMQYKMHAREALRGIKPHNQQAQKIIGTRILHAIYKD